jgi:hypothetical protein
MGWVRPTTAVSYPVAELEGQLSGAEFIGVAVSTRPEAAGRASPKLTCAWTGLVQVWRLRASRS